MPAPSVIRQLGAQDIDAYVALRFRALEENPTSFTSSTDEERPVDLERYVSRLNGKVARTFGAFVGERLVGIATLERLQRMKERHRAQLVGVYVAPEHARQGTGKALVLAAIEAARESGDILRIDLTVTAINHDALALYQSVGFETWGSHPGALRLDGREFAKLHMQLRL